MAAARPLACNLTAISIDQQPRYRILVDRLPHALTDHRELSDGYAYHLDTTTISLPEVAGWITMERQCALRRSHRGTRTAS